MSIFKGIINTIAKHKYEIIRGAGYMAIGFGGYCAFKAGPVVKEKLETAKAEKGVEKLTVVETVKTVGKDVALPAGCIIGGTMLVATGNRMQVHELVLKEAQAVANYGTLKKATDVVKNELERTNEQNKNYIAATKEIVGEDKEREIHAKSVENSISSRPVSPIVYGSSIDGYPHYDRYANVVYYTTEAEQSRVVMEMERERLQMLNVATEKLNSGKYGQFDDGDPKYHDANEYKQYIYYNKYLKKLNIHPTELTDLFRFDIEVPIAYYTEPITIAGYEGAVLCVRFEHEPEYDYSQDA